MNTASSQPPFAENGPASVAELANTLQEKLVLRQVLYDETQEYAVVTELRAIYRGWCFRAAVLVNGQATDDLALAPEEGNIRTEETEEAPPETFVKRAAEKHREKCREVQRYIDAEVKQRQGRKKRRIIGLGIGLLCLALLAGGGYWALRAKQPQEARQVVARPGEKFEYALPLAPGRQARLVSGRPAWLAFDATAFRLSGTPPEAEKGNVYPLAFETVAAAQSQIPGSKVKNALLNALKVVGLDATQGKLLVTLTIQEQFVAPQLSLEYATIRGKIANDQHGIPTIILKKADVVTVTVVDKNTGETVAQGLINIQLANEP